MIQQIHGLLYVVGTVLLLATLVVVIGLFMVPTLFGDATNVAKEKRKVRRGILLAYLVLWGLCLGIILFRIGSIASSNRMPLETTDRTSIYDQSRGYKDK